MSPHTSLLRLACAALCALLFTAPDSHATGRVVHEVFRDASASVSAPVISWFNVVDPQTDCPMGYTEFDSLVLFRTLTFTPSFADDLKQAKVTMCVGMGGMSYRDLIVGTPATILSSGDMVGGLEVSSIFEWRQWGNTSYVAGSYLNGDNFVLEGTWTAGSVSWQEVVGTGDALGNGSNLEFFTGFDATYDGATHHLAATYQDDMGRHGLATFDRSMGYAPRVLFLASDLSFAQLQIPRFGLDCARGLAPGDPGCASPADLFVSYYGASSKFGPPQSLLHTWIVPGTLSANTAISLGDQAPGFTPGVTITGFQTGFSHAAGNQTGGFAAFTSSGSSGYFQYDSSSVDPPRLRLGDTIPDTTTPATGFETPSYDYTNFSAVTRGGSAVPGAFVAEVDVPGVGDVLASGFRAGTDPVEGSDTTDVFTGNHALAWGIGALGLGYDDGSEGIGILDVGRVEVLRGPQAVLFGSDAGSGIVQLDQTFESGFEVELRLSFSTFAGGTLDLSGKYFFGTGAGVVWEYEGDTPSLTMRGTTGITDLRALAVDDADNLYGASGSTLFSILRPGFTGSMIANFADGSGPVLDISGLDWDPDCSCMRAVSQGGIYYGVDLGNAFLTPEFQIGLPNTTLESLSHGEGRIWTGHADGRLSKYYMPMPYTMSSSETVAAAGPPPPPPTLPGAVVGDIGPNSLPALVFVPEPDARALELAALLTLAVLVLRRHPLRPGGSHGHVA